MDRQDTSNKVNFKQTLNLPKTDFPIRANAKENDKKILTQWEKEKVSIQAQKVHLGNKQFILHDGPPYANGHLHLGHAYNKILKDIICKFHRMTGKHVPYTPGWDCHGLPIELQVKKNNPDYTGSTLKKACRAYAEKWITVQKNEFKQLGILMDWDHPYLTMSPTYEASILRAFGLFVDRGYIERKEKTVPWCISCKTVLASAEIEYKDKKDPSIYALFELDTDSKKRLFPEIKQSIYVAVWTTTPWTLPLNQGVMVKPNATYVIIEVENKLVIVGEKLADALVQLIGGDKKIIKTFSSSLFGNKESNVKHPFIEKIVPLLFDQEVSLEEGTAFVHCSPESGPVDYEIGIKNNLPILSTINEDGVYKENTEPKELIGTSVTKAHGFIIKTLLEKNKLLAKKSITHSYPHCWRCQNPLIFRATKQWFCSLTHNNVKNKTLQTIENITMKPKSSKKRLYTTIEDRLEWCLSRQRAWGVPIIAIICNQCDYTHITKELIDTIANEIAKKGIEYWDTIGIKDIIEIDFRCPCCSENNWRKETDILDVWFDSGVSHFAVLKEKKQYPANLYLEGKDQHRGWFQSSLLTSLMLNENACTEGILTHGFTVDEKGHKMSKSLGNVVSPHEMIKKLGTDGLRLWTSSIDYAHDAVVSETLLKNIQQVHSKIRNTCRFLLSNIFDFDYKTDALPLEKLYLIDQYALQELFTIQTLLLQAYEAYEFTKVFQLLSEYCTVHLSSFYLDIIKDRLYVEQADGFKRRSAQTACFIILDAITRLIAPILSFTAEQVSDNYQKEKTTSIHLQTFAHLESIWILLSKKHSEIATIMPHQKDTKTAFDFIKPAQKALSIFKKNPTWEYIIQIRSELLKAIERKRETGEIKHSLEAKILLFISSSESKNTLFDDFTKELTANNQNIVYFMKEFLIVSQCEIVNSFEGLNKTEIPGLFVKVVQAEGEKCPRCWQWSITNHTQNVCTRCERIIKAL